MRRVIHWDAVKLDSRANVELNEVGERESAVRRREEYFPARNGRRIGSEVGRWWIL